MIHSLPPAFRGFTLIELLTAMLVLSILALTSYRGLDAVLDARANVATETAKWRNLGTFFSRFETDVHLAEPRAARNASGEIPAWVGRKESLQESLAEPLLEFSRSGAIDGMDAPRRVGYRLNGQAEIELWLWPSLDAAPGTMPVRHAVLGDVKTFQLQYMNEELAWIETWPPSRVDPPVPRAVKLRIVLGSGEEILRVFALKL